EHLVPVVVGAQCGHVVPGGFGQDPFDVRAHSDQFVGLQYQIGDGALTASAGLVQHHAGVGECGAFARCAGCQEYGPGGDRLTHAGGGDVGTDVTHRVHHAGPCAGMAAPGGDVELKVLC